MAPRSCLASFPLASCCRAVGGYVLGLYAVLTVLNSYRLVQQAVALRDAEDDLLSHAPPTASAGQSDAASSVSAAAAAASDARSDAAAAAGLRAERAAVLRAAQLTIFETLFFLANMAFAGLLMGGVARRSVSLVAAFLAWFAPVTALQAGSLLAALLRPQVGGFRACAGPGCLAAFLLFAALVMFHGLLCGVVVAYLRELRGQLREERERQQLEAAGVQKKEVINFAFTADCGEADH